MHKAYMKWHITLLQLIFLMGPLTLLLGCSSSPTAVTTVNQGQQMVKKSSNLMGDAVPHTGSSKNIIFSDSRYMISTSNDKTIRVLDIQTGKTTIINPKKPSPSVNVKIEFDVNSYALRPDTLPVLDRLGKTLTYSMLRKKNILIKGYADSDGNNASNMKLSTNRALAVKKYLVSKAKISPKRLFVVGYGESLPVAANTSQEQKQRNRRVEIRLAP